MNTFREAFIAGAARAFFVSSYADFVENQDGESDLPSAGAGEDWMDVAPETPARAVELAEQLWTGLEKANSCTVEELGTDAAEADREGDCCTEPECCGTFSFEDIDADQFGHYLAMQAMGH